MQLLIKPSVYWGVHNMKKIIFLAIALVSNSFAGDIAEPFGIKIGKKINRDQLVLDDSVMLRVSPPEPNKLFSDYWVKVTPKTNLVSQVFAFTEQEQDCINTADKVFTLLKEKYKDIAKSRKANDANPRFFAVVLTPDVSVSVVCEAQASNYRLFIMYDGLKIKENEDLDASEDKIDSTGL